MGEWIGRSVARREDVDLLQGRRRYVADLRLPEAEWGPTAHVQFVRSHEAHGRIVSIDTADARTRPGVIAVITAADHDVVPHGSIQPEYYSPRFAMPILAEHVVRFVGEPVAAVVAETPAQAIDAAEQVVVDIEPLPAVVVVADAGRDDVVLFSDGSRARCRDTETDPGPETKLAITRMNASVRRYSTLKGLRRKLYTAHVMIEEAVMTNVTASPM